MTSRRLAAVVAGSLFSVAALAGCGDSDDAELAGSWDEILEAANEEGEVVVYGTVAPDNLELLKQAFEKEYPEIESPMCAAPTRTCSPRWRSRHQTDKGTADVHMTTDAGWIDRSLDADYSVEVVGRP